MSGVNGQNEGTFAYVPLNKIRENPVAIRTVDKKTEDYQAMVDSVRSKGILSPILVREIKNPETGELEYGLVNGLQRFNAAQDAGLDKIPAFVKNIADGEIIEAQIITNLHTIETRPVEYAKGLQRMFMQNPTLTQAELAKRVNKSPIWVGQRLNLVKLESNPEIKKLVDNGDITVSNAVALAKLPPDERAGFVERAMTMNPQEFVPLAANRAKEIAAEKRKGKSATPEEFVALPHFRKSSEMQEEMKTNGVGQSLLRSGKIKDLATWAYALQWAMKIDPDTFAERKAEDDKRKEQAKTLSDAKKKEKMEKRAKEAAEKAAALA